MKGVIIHAYIYKWLTDIVSVLRAIYKPRTLSLFCTNQVENWENENCTEWNLSVEECEEAKKNGSIPVSYDDDGDLVYDQCDMYNITGKSRN